MLIYTDFHKIKEINMCQLMDQLKNYVQKKNNK